MLSYLSQILSKGMKPHPRDAVLFKWSNSRRNAIDSSLTITICYTPPSLYFTSKIRMALIDHAIQVREKIWWFTMLCDFHQVGSFYEYFNKNAIFGVVQPDSFLYLPILALFAFTGLPTAGNKRPLYFHDFNRRWPSLPVCADWGGIWMLCSAF